MAFLYISRRELSNGGLHSSGDLKLTPARFLDHPVTVVAHAVLVLKPVHAVLDQRFMAVLFRTAATVRKPDNTPELELSQAVFQIAAKLVMPPPASRHCILSPNAEKVEAQADRANTSMENLHWHLLDFLTYVLVGAWNLSTVAQSSGHATEQAESQKNDIIEGACQDIVCEKFSEWAEQLVGKAYYDEPSMRRSNQLWDVISRNKDGSAKEKTFNEWCKRVQGHTEAASTASADTPEERVSNCFRSLAFDVLTNDLTPAQRRETKYKIRINKITGEGQITTPQRGFINAILRKNLGDAKVAQFIWHHGLPLPLKRKATSKAMLAHMFEELMIWHASLLQNILERDNHPDMGTARKLADLDQKRWREDRRKRKMETKQRMVQGSRLAKERDGGKRKNR